MFKVVIPDFQIILHNSSILLRNIQKGKLKRNPSKEKDFFLISITCLLRSKTFTAVRVYQYLATTFRFYPLQIISFEFHKITFHSITSISFVGKKIHVWLLRKVHFSQCLLILSHVVYAVYLRTKLHTIRRI